MKASARSRRAAVLTGLLGAGAVVLAGTRTWASVPVSDLSGLRDVAVGGRQAAPAAVALALAAGAGAIVLGTAGRAVRLVTAAGLVVAGVLVEVACVAVVRNPLDAARDVLAQATGVAGEEVVAGASRLTAWPWVAVAGGALIIVAGLVGLAFGARWPAPSRRYEAPAARGAAGAGSAGAAGGASAPETSQQGTPEPAAEHGSPATGPATGPATSDDLPDQVWDALSRGDDPT